MNVAAFLSYVILGTYTPGPNNIMAMSTASRFGFRRGMRYGFGAAVGFLFIMSLCTVFGVLLFEYIPRIEGVMKWVGAAYMLFLAWIIVRDKPHEEGKAFRLRPDSLLTGVLMQFFNPKLFMFCITVLSTFILPFYRSPLALCLFALALSVVGLSSMVCWALFGSVFQRLFTTHRRLMNWIMALLLAFCAASVLL